MSNETMTENEYFVKLRKAFQSLTGMEYTVETFIVKAKNAQEAFGDATERLGEHNGCELLDIRRI